jgi:hypothetical protein
MSKRFSHLWRITTTLCAVLALFASVSQPAQAANTVVRISKTQDALLGLEYQVNISLDNTASLRGLGGFDFLIAYDYPPLTLLDATPGALLDSCGWEYFSYRSGAQGDCGGPCPTGFVRLVALAETDNGDFHPSCFLSGQSGTLATLRFLIANDLAYACLDFPISFYWLNCGDNIMSSLSGDTLYLSHKVFDFSNQDDITGQLGYGGWQGIAGSPNCLGTVVNTDTVLDFHNGEIRVICNDTVDYRGDINLNGIPYEVADLSMLCNYFLFGLDSLPAQDRELAIAASDVNADGIALGYLDAVYLLRIILGDAPPYSKLRSSDGLNAYFNQDTTNHRIMVSYPGELAGAYLVMGGNVTPTFTVAPGFLQQYHFDGAFTHILILGDLDHRYGRGIWFTYQGMGTLQSVETTDWHNTSITSQISYNAGNCGDFDGSGSINIADAVYVIRFIFSGGVAPVDIHGGDVNCDGTCDIGDIVYLLAYMFSGGPAPCENCK